MNLSMIFTKDSKDNIGVVNSASSMICSHVTTVKPVCNDHLYKIIYYLWLIQLCVVMNA